MGSTSYFWKVIHNYLVIVDLILLTLIQRPDKSQIFKQFLIFRDCPRNRRMMLLVTWNHMTYQWAFSWEKCSCTFNRLSLPLFTFFFGIDLLVFFVRAQKSKLSSNAKIWNWNQNHLFKNCISRELMWIV